ncbi:hypothetical protein [Mariprofundus ferrooxydans]|uniref:Uncharacterized protein n=1 Tax=Mariprofundus ferrooxydans PV-1 TaxID=314345 RepID=Q0EZB8_9PROT|nr:hypothetical protein [Mariprofundus ferrooxydans]EAU54506.1 hypothetical protein SPV1_07421 [Mariprofundus ferrooxydans PV-1]KON48863.1 hypothetical protein AL013_00570 [Mariprofundus ferrooxydans]
MSLTDRWCVFSGILTAAVLVVFTYPTNAYAYIGPGLGVGTIGAVLGILGSIFLALVAIIWYPIKRLFKKIKDRNNDAAD